MVDAVCVKTATISGVTHGSVVDADTVISCTADVNARPPAIYIWTNHVDNSLSAGPQFVLQPGTQYKLTCTASNNFNRCNATNYVEFNSKLYVVFVVCFHSVVNLSVITCSTVSEFCTLLCARIENANETMNVVLVLLSSCSLLI